MFTEHLDRAEIKCLIIRQLGNSAEMHMFVARRMWNAGIYWRNDAALDRMMVYAKEHFQAFTVNAIPSMHDGEMTVEMVLTGQAKNSVERVSCCVGVARGMEAAAMSRALRWAQVEARVGHD